MKLEISNMELGISIIALEITNNSGDMIDISVNKIDASRDFFVRVNILSSKQITDKKKS